MKNSFTVVVNGFNESNYYLCFTAANNIALNGLTNAAIYKTPHERIFSIKRLIFSQRFLERFVIIRFV